MPSTPKPYNETVREALDKKRVELLGKVTSLVLCKHELFYQVDGKTYKDSVYPVNEKIIKKEAKFFGVQWSHE